MATNILIGGTLSSTLGEPIQASSETFDIICPASAPTSYANKTVFTHTGADQFFNTSALGVSVCWVKVKIWGAGGAGDGRPEASRSRGGAGGYTEFIFNPSQFNSLPVDIVVVVGEGGKRGSLVSTYGAGGAGGNRTFPGTDGSSGGGLSGLFKVDFSTVASDSYIIAIAGGGGSSYNSFMDIAGAGGGLVAGDGSGGFAGGGGTQFAGGLAGPGGGNAGGYLQGASGGFIGTDEKVGGGGSSYIDSTFVEAATLSLLQGTGQTPPQQLDPDYIPSVGVGGPQTTNGGDGLIVFEWD